MLDLSSFANKRLHSHKRKMAKYASKLQGARSFVDPFLNLDDEANNIFLAISFFLHIITFRPLRIDIVMLGYLFSRMGRLLSSNEQEERAQKLTKRAASLVGVNECRA